MGQFISRGLPPLLSSSPTRWTFDYATVRREPFQKYTLAYVTKTACTVLFVWCTPFDVSFVWNARRRWRQERVNAARRLGVGVNVDYRPEKRSIFFFFYGFPLNGEGIFSQIKPTIWIRQKRFTLARKIVVKKKKNLNANIKRCK